MTMFDDDICPECGAETVMREVGREQSQHFGTPVYEAIGARFCEECGYSEMDD